MPLPATSIHPSMQHAVFPAFPNGSAYAGKHTLVFRVRHRDSGELLKEHSLILMPARLSQSTDVRTALYYTKGAPHADTPESNGIGMTYFTITGHTGFGGIRSGPLSPVAGRLTTATLPEVFAGVVNT